MIEHHSKSYMHECYYQNECELKIERIQVWICDKTSLTKIVCIFVALFQPSSRSPSVSRLLLLSTIHRKNRTFHDLVPCKLFCFAAKSASHIEALCALLLLCMRMNTMEKVPRNMSASLEQKLPIIMSCNCCVLEAHKKMQCTQLCVQNDEKKTCYERHKRSQTKFQWWKRCWRRKLKMDRIKKENE